VQYRWWPFIQWFVLIMTTQWATLRLNSDTGNVMSLVWVPFRPHQVRDACLHVQLQCKVCCIHAHWLAWMTIDETWQSMSNISDERKQWTPNVRQQWRHSFGMQTSLLLPFLLPLVQRERVIHWIVHEWNVINAINVCLKWNEIEIEIYSKSNLEFWSYKNEILKCIFSE